MPAIPCGLISRTPEMRGLRLVCSPRGQPGRTASHSLPAPFPNHLFPRSLSRYLSRSSFTQFYHTLRAASGRRPQTFCSPPLACNARAQCALAALVKQTVDTAVDNVSGPRVRHPVHCTLSTPLHSQIFFLAPTASPVSPSAACRSAMWLPRAPKKNRTQLLRRPPLLSKHTRLKPSRPLPHCSTSILIVARLPRILSPRHVFPHIPAQAHRFCADTCGTQAKARSSAAHSPWPWSVNASVPIQHRSHSP